jgi:hypothetical protein
VFTASPTNVNTFSVSVDTNQNKNVAQLDERGKPFPRYQFGGTYQSLGQNSPVSRDARNGLNFSETFSSRWKSHRLAVES